MFHLRRFPVGYDAVDFHLPPELDVLQRETKRRDQKLDKLTGETKPRLFKKKNSFTFLIMASDFWTLKLRAAKTKERRKKERDLKGHSTSFIDGGTQQVKGKKIYLWIVLEWKSQINKKQTKKNPEVECGNCPRLTANANIDPQSQSPPLIRASLNSGSIHRRVESRGTKSRMFCRMNRRLVEVLDHMNPLNPSFFNISTARVRLYRRKFYFFTYLCGFMGESKRIKTTVKHKYKEEWVKNK